VALVLVTGPPASGTTTIARPLARQPGVLLLGETPSAPATGPGRGGWERPAWLAELPAQATQQVLKPHLRAWDRFHVGLARPTTTTTTTTTTTAALTTRPPVRLSGRLLSVRWPSTGQAERPGAIAWGPLAAHADPLLGPRSRAGRGSIRLEQRPSGHSGSLLPWAALWPHTARAMQTTTVTSGRRDPRSARLPIGSTTCGSSLATRRSQVRTCHAHRGVAGQPRAARSASGWGRP